MAGERMCAGNLHEVSVHADFQGRGLARKLTLKLVGRQMQRGKTSFLHVMSHNAPARGLYEKMGLPDLQRNTGARCPAIRGFGFLRLTSFPCWDSRVQTGNSLQCSLANMRTS